MDYSLASNDQLLTIVGYDHFCPTPLIRGVAVEMMKRKLWNGVILYAGRKAYRNLDLTLEYGLKIPQEEFIHLGHIEIMRCFDKFLPGKRSFKTYVIMHLISKFKNMKRDAETEKRIANIHTEDVDGLPIKMQERIFLSPANVERFVINKIMIENSWHSLRKIEQEAITLEQAGYSQYEIADKLGVHQRHGNTLLKRAYEKLRKSMGA